METTKESALTVRHPGSEEEEPHQSPPTEDMADVEVGNFFELQERNLYEQTDDVLRSAFMMFCLPDMRDLARKGLLHGHEERIQRIIDLPATVEDIRTVFEENRDLLTEARLKEKERAQMYFDTLTLKKFGVDDAMKTEAAKHIFLMHFEDANEEEECVYMIILNTVGRRVGVFFRGSVTQKDFRQDAKSILSFIANPVKGNDHLAAELGVHHGFREYLYNDIKMLPAMLPVMPNSILTNNAVFRKMQAKPACEHIENNGTIMKYKVILEQVHVLLKENPDYAVFIGGHSLGAALSVLLVLEAAADDRFPTPVTCITSGGPKVGNFDFLLAFEELERQKKLRCVQVANDRDPVTLSPPLGTIDPFFAAFCQGRKYRHVGLRIKLREKGYVLMYPMKMRTWPGIFLCDCMNILRTWMFIIGFGVASLLCYSAFFYISIPVVSQVWVQLALMFIDGSGLMLQRLMATRLFVVPFVP